NRRLCIYSARADCSSSIVCLAAVSSRSETTRAHSSRMRSSVDISLSPGGRHDRKLPEFMWAAVRDRPCGESSERYLGRCCSSHPEKTVFSVLDEQLYTRRRAPFFLRQSSHTP